MFSGFSNNTMTYNEMCCIICRYVYFCKTVLFIVVCVNRMFTYVTLTSVVLNNEVNLLLLTSVVSNP